MRHSSAADLTLYQFDSDYFAHKTSRAIEAILPPFFRITKRDAYLHWLFLTLLIGLGSAFLYSLATLQQSPLIASLLAALVTTLFTFLLLRLQMRKAKTKKLERIRDAYIATCKHLINYQAGVPDSHMALAEACIRCAAALEGAEQRYYRLFKRLTLLTPHLEKLGQWHHWEDVHKMRELLLLYAIDQQIEWLKCEPANLEVHTALANAYVTLSSLYREENGLDPGSPEAKLRQERFRKASRHAIEEFHILHSYAPDDPWIHTQLAYSYRDLGMPKEEIRELERVVQHWPDDLDALFSLGMLYFSQGMNAKGLEIYEQLRDLHPKKAEKLIACYGAPKKYCI